MGLFKRKLVDEDILGIIEKKDIIKRYIMFTAGIFIYAIAYNVFFLKYNLVYGGTGGLATILQEYIDPSITILLFSFIMFVITYIFLDKKSAMNTLFGMIILPIFVKLTAGFEIDIPNDDLMLIAICGAVIAAFGNGLAGNTGFSIGGMDALVHLIEVKFKVPYGKAFSTVNGLIVICGGFKFGWRTLLYALIIIYIMSIVADKVILFFI